MNIPRLRRRDGSIRWTTSKPSSTSRCTGVWIACLLISLASFPLHAAVPESDSTKFIEVKFKQGTDLSFIQDGRKVELYSTPLPVDLLDSMDKMTRLFTLPPETLDKLKAKGDKKMAWKAEKGFRAPPGWGSSLPNLNSWFRITLKPGVNPAKFLERLKHLDSVEVAERVPSAISLPATPDFEGDQDYLRDPTVGGIEAEYSWTIPGGDARGVKIYDIEWGWNQDHEDLSKAENVTQLLDSGDSKISYMKNSTEVNHGTAVLGEMVADKDSKGVTGISWGADVGLAPIYTDKHNGNTANAILLATADGQPGDVILLEIQVAPICGLTFPTDCPDASKKNCWGPVEESQAVFDAIQVAVANGLVVVEAAGNGHADLDSAACGDTFDRTVRDSGAIIVGAGEPPARGDRERRATSSYGSRVDVQGWGTSVTTTAYGSPASTHRDSANPDDPDLWYTSGFNGTSAASPIVAGAVANLQGIALEMFGTPLDAFQVRELLKETGQPQQPDDSENIGPRPDLRAAIDRLIQAPLDLFFLVDLSGSYEDDLPEFQARASEIIEGIQEINPDVRFGLGWFSDFPIDPFGSEAADDKAYERILDMTSNANAILDEIDGIDALLRFGGDDSESQLEALYQVATGFGKVFPDPELAHANIPANQGASFREDATKLILLWTDAPFHLPTDEGGTYPGPAFDVTVAALEGLDIPESGALPLKVGGGSTRVAGISSGGGGITDLELMSTATGTLAPPESIDCDGDGTADIGAGAPMVCTVGEAGEGIAAAMLALVRGSRQAVAPLGVPDLTVIDLSPSTTLVSPAGAFTLEATVINVGQAAAGGTTLRFHRSNDATITPDDPQVGLDIDILPLGVGGTSTHSVSTIAPISPCTFWVGACVDQDSDEIRLRNRCTGGIPIRLAAPDLTVPTVTLRQTALEPGEEFSINATVANIGGAGSGSTTLRYYRSTDRDISTSDLEIGSDVIDPLAPGAISPQDTMTLTPATGTGWWIGACVDKDLSANECDTSNQCLAIGWPLTVDTLSPAPVTEVAKRTAADAVWGDLFGFSVSISGDRVVVGGRKEDANPGDSGAAYIFERAGGAWVETDPLIVEDITSGDLFGTAVAISGDVAMVGAPAADAVWFSSGTVHVFEYQSGDWWAHLGRLTPSDAASADFFGRSVAISGDVAVAGAPGDDDGGSASGSAYVFERTADGWVEAAKLTASDAALADQFGLSVAVSGDTVVVGAYLNDDVGSGSGSAYVFQRTATGDWVQVRKLTAGDAASGDQFGTSVAIDEDTLVVGAPGDDEASWYGFDEGAVYVFERDHGGLDNWGEVKKLTPLDALAPTFLGASVAIAGDTIVAGAYNKADFLGHYGSVYVFERDRGGAGNWGEVEKLTASDQAVGDHFGAAVAVADVAVVGAPRDDDAGPHTDSGSIYVFAPCLDSDGDTVCDE